MNSILVADQAAHQVSVAPRVSLADIDAAIETKYEFVAGDLIASRYLNALSICLLVMNNGFVVIGKSAPASPENFDRVLGKHLAYEDALRQLWPLMGYALRERLSQGG